MQPPPAQGRVLRLGHGLFDVVEGAGHGNQQALGAGIQHVGDTLMVGRRHAHQRADSVLCARRDELRRLGIRIAPMLHVDQEEVKSAVLEDCRNAEGLQFRQKRPQHQLSRGGALSQLPGQFHRAEPRPFYRAAGAQKRGCRCAASHGAHTHGARRRLPGSIAGRLRSGRGILPASGGIRRDTHPCIPHSAGESCIPGAGWQGRPPPPAS